MDTPLQRRGLMFVLSSPSGAGKTTITRALLKNNSDLEISISATTRQRRPSEVDGQHYYFVDIPSFNAMVENGEMLEHAKVFNNYYGTPRQPVEEALARGHDIIFDIDWQGTQQLREIARDDLVTVFRRPNGKRARSREDLRQPRWLLRRPVEEDRDGRLKVRRQPGQHPTDGLQSARGRGEDHELITRSLTGRIRSEIGNGFGHTMPLAVTQSAARYDIISYFVTVIGIACRFGLTASVFGRRTVSTPSLNSAAIFFSSIPPGNGSVRWNVPK